MQLTPSDLELLKSKGISEKEVEEQLETFKNGIPFVKIIDFAKVGDGILRLSEDAKKNYTEIYENSSFKVVKFTPASGAATRMFKALHAFIKETEIKENIISELLELEEYSVVKRLINGIDNLPFYTDALEHAVKKHHNFEEHTLLEQKALVLKAIIDKDGLEYGEYPKGLIPFHQYADKTLNPFEEHLDEAKAYAKKEGKAFLNFSISEEHEIKFKENLEKYLKTYANDDIDFQVSFYYQKQKTDTIAVNLDNTPFRDENKHLFFRPGGHGALILNLNDIDADLIFIKNIDNVSKRQQDKNDTIAYKKALAGLLIDVQNKLFEYQRHLEKSADNKLLEEVRTFMMDTLNIKSPSERPEELLKELHKPLRVCGMVQNDGEPGGGPFWIEDDGHVSLQIVETSQIDQTKDKQKEILTKATHFNPVDIVCGVKDYKGNLFDLEEFVNPKRAFIAEKSIEGTNIKALELPGLWNGAMEHWHSIFVEVPISTFNPVKTLADLLKPAHQNN
jgi:hypothetical protein